VRRSSTAVVALAAMTQLLAATAHADLTIAQAPPTPAPNAAPPAPPPYPVQPAPPPYPVQPAPPPSFVPPASPQPPMGPRVFLRIDRQTARLQQRTMLGWSNICIPPCGAVVDPSALYRVGGGGAAVSEEFQLPRSSGDVYVDGRVGSKASRVVGLGFMIVGLLIGGFGALVWTSGQTRTRTAEDNPQHGHRQPSDRRGPGSDRAGVVLGRPHLPRRALSRPSPGAGRIGHVIVRGVRSRWVAVVALAALSPMLLAHAARADAATAAASEDEEDDDDDDEDADAPSEETGPRVILRVDRPAAKLQQKTMLGWRDICVRPCGAAVAPFGRYRVAGGGAVPSPSFELPRTTGDVFVEGKVGSRPQRIIGISLVVHGLVLGAFGTFGWIANEPESKEAREIAQYSIGLNVLLGVVGLVLVQTARTSLRVR
jgi:hypothetical protein